MANNNFDSNFTRKLARSFLASFENERIVSKNVNTQFIQTNSFDPSTGDTIDIKRPTDFVSAFGNSYRYRYGARLCTVRYGEHRAIVWYSW